MRFNLAHRPVPLRTRTLTQEDPGDNQISLEEVIRLVRIKLFIFVVYSNHRHDHNLYACAMVETTRGAGWWSQLVRPQTEDGGKVEPFENLSALEIAEQLTLLDHLVFKVIPYE